MSEQELLTLLEAAGVDVVPFLAAVDRFESKLIQYLIALGHVDDAKAALSKAQAETADATAEGWETIASAEGVDDPDQH